MNHRIAAVLAVRLIGLGLVIWRLPDFMGVIDEAVYRGITTFRLGWSVSNANYPLRAGAMLAQGALGFYMLLGGKRLVRLLLRGLPNLPGICERCGYNTSGLEGGRCPECGAKVPERQ